MSRKLYVLFVTVLTCGLVAVAAGCGGGGGGGDTATTSTPTSGATGSPANKAAADAARRGCEAGIKNNPALAADKRAELSKECQKLADAAATGDRAKIKAAYTSYCNKLAAALPAQAQAPAKASCLQGADTLR